jgi:hypothetical protein
LRSSGALPDWSRYNEGGVRGVCTLARRSPFDSSSCASNLPTWATPFSIRFTQGVNFGASTIHTFATACQFACPLARIRPASRPSGTFTTRLPTGPSPTLPVAGYNYNSDWTLLLVGLSPTGMAASLAAPEVSHLLDLQPCWLLPGLASTGKGRLVTAHTQAGRSAAHRKRVAPGVTTSDRTASLSLRPAVSTETCCYVSCSLARHQTIAHFEAGHAS